MDPELERALVRLAGAGLPIQPRCLKLASVTWGGSPSPHVAELTVENDGTLRLEAQPLCEAAVVPDPENWTASCFEADVEGHGRLTVSKGTSDIIRRTYGGERSQAIAVLHGWCWSAGSGDGARLWVAPIRFMTDRPPVVLSWKRGNMLLVVDNQTVHGWCFTLVDHRVFLLPNGDQWYFAIDARTEPRPDAALVHLVRSVIGFAIGEPIGLGLFQPVGEEGVLPGLAHLDLFDENRGAHDVDRKPPAVPFDSASSTARFVERVVALARREPDAPVLAAVHLYFAALRGFVESNFLHAWLGTEALVRWGMKSNRLSDPGRTRLADHGKWADWVRARAAEIEALAMPGMPRSLIDRVRDAENDRPTRVQRAFRGLGIPWTAEMDDAERARHGVAHEGAFPDDARDSDRDRARVGLATTMLTAMLAKLAEYDGPIADRAKTVFDITGRDQPDWWPPIRPCPDVQYCGQGVDQMLAKARAVLDEHVIDHREG